jgi:hypothetical protein
MWTYLNTPFLMALPSFEVEEIAPWQEGEETWRVLRATFPAEIESHCPLQEFYFGPDSLLRRHDYQVDISGSFPTAQYVFDITEADGIKFPTKRRAHPRSAEWSSRPRPSLCLDRPQRLQHALRLCAPIDTQSPFTLFHNLARISHRRSVHRGSE